MKKIELFYSPVCPHCPKARELLKEYKAATPGFEYTEVDTYTSEGVDRGMSINVMAVPSFVVDDEIKLVGWPFTAEDISKAIQ
ncbi:thioredoxin [Candidatus Bathyarchaeota archaeon]|jgi:glutaredoxin|nr:thioredoxin [Candidatus Bathyarchaeota archaeon]MBT4320280.1 thioredoxin [Candidatus Bathyarchaeota archaeon]MBT4425024.1 thioredoxin [Candidatus Bathyarchaeota archaeon]MBT5643417.1 thioredoxin [Candidatus Bathyarchaeota archaeon]MBT6603775.1 thioredoxin [Candidatus Bathyarchaeota archaeon]